MQSIVSAVAHFANERPDRVAVIANDVKITYGELWKEIRGFANFIKKQNLPEKSRIIVKSDSDVWFAVS
jgi:acyl-CoA synthetase (AMP-forming)/AMP-acid ligase II